MVITAKEEAFVSRKMGFKGVHLVPGIGSAAARKFASQGFVEAVDVYEMFLDLDKPQFSKWLNEIGGLNSFHRDMVQQCFERYMLKWGSD